QEDDEFIRCVYTRKFKIELEKFNLKKLEKGLFVTGPLALMLINFEINDFPSLALLPYAEQGRPDPRAASNAINIINSLLGMNVNTEQLITDAETIENELREVIEQQEVKESEGHKGMYV
ncbi:MAG: PAC2 family protein, partial [Candidatus Odinarchaeia archaeon]